MRKVRIESDSHDLIAGFVAGVEWVNDAAITVVQVDDTGSNAFAVLEGRDGEGEDAVLSLTVNGLQAKE